MADDSRARQVDEAESIEAIFGDDFCCTGTWKDDSESDVSFAVTLSPTLSVRLRLAADYPDVSRPDVDITWSGTGGGPNRSELASHIETLPLGEEIVYSILSWFQEKLEDGFNECESSPVVDNLQTTSGYSVSAAAQSDQIIKTPGQLPAASYFRAESLGEGGFGSVMHVYDDDGNAWAAKQFALADDGGIDTTTLREVGLLRALRGASTLHPNVVKLVDMAHINGELCMIMQSYKCSLRDALLGGVMETTQSAQLRVAKGLLSAVAFLHASSTMHRDIKPGNVMLTDELEPILIDFSLAKVDVSSLAIEEAPRTAKERRRKARGKKVKKDEDVEARHSQGVGTPLYMAPEVSSSDDYSDKADVWSLGIVLLEVFNADFRMQLEQCEKEKAAHALVAQASAGLGDEPTPNLLKSLVDLKPSCRPSAKSALDSLCAIAPSAALGDVPNSPGVCIVSSTSATSTLADDVLQDLRLWSSFFRCSSRALHFAGIYTSRSQHARDHPLHAVILAARLHETDAMQAAPLYDLEELEEWLEDEANEDEDMLERLDGLDGYFDSEKQILHDLDYQLY